MSTLLKSKVVIIYVLASLMLSVVLLSEGYTGAGILIIASLIALFFLCFVIAGTDIFVKNKNTLTYERESVLRWLYTRTSFITEQSLLMVAFRLLVLLVCFFICIQGILNNSLPFFSDEIIFNKLLFVCLLSFSFLYLMFGLRFCSIPAFSVFVMIMSSYYAHIFMHSLLIDERMHNLCTYSIITLVFSSAALFLMNKIKRELCYYDIQQYEKKSCIYVSDLFLSNFDFSSKYKRLIKINADVYDSINKISVNELSTELFYAAHFNRLLYVGGVISLNKKEACFYFYAPECTLSFFYRSVISVFKKFNVNLQSTESSDDAMWNLYRKRLFPNNSELCEINSRNHLQGLFAKGMTFDSEYQILFYVNFKDKQDPIDFEQIIGYFGFTLTYASFEEEHDNFVNAQYKYVGEYRISSYISPRRLEHLNNLLLFEAEKYGCAYLGEWQIDSFA